MAKETIFEVKFGYTSFYILKINNTLLSDLLFSNYPSCFESNIKKRPILGTIFGSNQSQSLCESEVKKKDFLKIITFHPSYQILGLKNISSCLNWDSLKMKGGGIDP